MPPPMFAESRIPITLDVDRVMIFNLNTMAAYEEASGKFYFDTLLSLYDLYQEELSRVINKLGKNPDLTNLDAKTQVNLLKIIRKVPMKELRDLLWATLHEYDTHGVPSWPLTKAQVGRLISPLAMPRIMNLIMTGHSANSPTRTELGEVKSAGPQPIRPVAQEQTHPESGGEPSFVLAEADLT